MQSGQKQYGLVNLSKNVAKNAGPSKLLNKPSIFDDSDSESDPESVSMPQFHSGSNIRKQAQAKIFAAVEQDPNIFQYDEVYEEMKSKVDNNKSKVGCNFYRHLFY